MANMPPQPAPPQAPQPPPLNHPDPNHPANHLDGGNPEHMIGYIDPGLPPKIRAYLEAAKSIVLTGPGGQTVRGLLSQTQTGLEKPIAAFVEKVVQKIEDKLGPLEDQEHDQVCFFIVGWIVSSLQAAKVPGLNTQAGRHDLIGRIMQAIDAMTQGQGQPPQGPNGAPPGGPPQGPPQGGPPPGAGGGAGQMPMDQFVAPGGGP